MKAASLFAALQETFSLRAQFPLPSMECHRLVLGKAYPGGAQIVLQPEAPPDDAQNLYFLCSSAPPPQANCFTYPDAAQTFSLYQAIQQLLEPERQLETQLAALDRLCLSGTLQQLVDLAFQLLGNPVMVLDRSFRPVCFSPSRKLGRPMSSLGQLFFKIFFRRRNERKK